MIQQIWGGSQRKSIICVDSYHRGVPEGRIYTPGMEVETFESMSQFLLKMETLLNEQQMPQSYTATRAFSSMVEPLGSSPSPFHVRRGVRATFEMQVIFRQHTSWQGVITWLDQELEQSFRSVLELILLMDSALRNMKGSDTA